jgi:signal transduction histidine kinase
VAGVAHEINTPVGIGITAISNLTDELDRMAELYNKDALSRGDFREFLQMGRDAGVLIQKNLERTASLVQSFKQLSVDQVSEQQRTFGLKDYLRDILSSLQPTFKQKEIELIIECDDQLEINSYPGVYAQVFTNLLLNSWQHGFHETTTGVISIKAELKNDMLNILYSDNGAGISKKDLPHIFEPFYTSDHRKGTGLGLNIVYNLIRQKLHGNIACASEEGKGALFTIEVPVR